MTTPLLATVLDIATVAGALWSFVLLLLKRPAGLLVLLGFLGLIELGLLVQAVLGLVALAGDHRPIESVTFVCYLIGSLLILPAAAWWARTEKSRWGVGVLLVACLVVPVMILRMNQVWAGSVV
ncbi:MAG TPA: hypothetical protein VG247_01465 [Pseudonocardiaceae bacterium]|jgi:hypothetical protein|nr:hypothetical protein [Pseudonocardiaceae bacterium]